jgi:LysR family transcriptional activator of nhaA
VDWLNYHHLLYFWTVAKEGSVSRAAESLHVAQPTVSAQIRSLERSLGQKLFDRQGRHLRLTSEGEKVFRYADEIFALGRELLQTVKGEPQAAPKKFRVGVSDAFRLHVRIDKTERLLAELAVHAVDLVVADAPMMPSLKVRAFSHLLGETTVSIFGAAALAREVRRKFPGSLHGAPMLLQTTNTALRQSLDQWFDVHGIQPRVVGEVEDMAMLQTLGEHGLGLFAAPTVVRREICRRYKVAWVGELDRVRERFYGISVERRITHPAVRLIADQAKRRLFT